MNTKSLFNRIIPLSIVLLVAGFVTANIVRTPKSRFYDDQESAQESEWLSYIKLVADENDEIISAYHVLDSFSPSLGECLLRVCSTEFVQSHLLSTFLTQNNTQDPFLFAYQYLTPRSI